MVWPAYFTVPSILFIFPFVSLVMSNCYCVRDNEIFDCSGSETTCNTPSSVDSGAQLCCVTGDVCGKDSICHFSKPIANTSGYYLGGCTDPTYNDPVCQRHCNGGTADIVYNATSQLWSCCGYPDNTVSCQNPRTDLTFQAIGLNDFPGTSSAAFSSSSTSSSPSTSTSSSTSTTPSTSSSMSPLSSTSSSTAATAGAASASGTTTVSQSSSGPSTGAVAGIAVAAVLIGLAIIAGFAAWFIRRKRRAVQADAAAAANIPGYFESPGYSGTSSSVYKAGMSEIYTPNKEPSVAVSNYYNAKPDVLHESDSRIVRAQLQGSEPTITELP